MDATIAKLTALGCQHVDGSKLCVDLELTATAATVYVISVYPAAKRMFKSTPVTVVIEKHAGLSLYTPVTSGKHLVIGIFDC